MVFTNKSNLVLIIVSLFFLSKLTTSHAYSGLATHDQNPLLIPYWIPHTIAPTENLGLQVSTSLFISNTLHDEKIANETLIIDAETYRFDLNLQYELADWIFHVQIPIIATEKGFLDDFIIKWHDTFGLPQGHRLNHSNNNVNFHYQNKSNELINTQDSYNGVGDISLVTVYPLFQSIESSWHFGLGINLPTGKNNELITNNKIDTSIWLSYLPVNNPFFITLGVINPGQGGVLKSEIKSSVLFAQTGIEISLNQAIKGHIQMDYHSSFISSKTDALGDSLQMQIGLQLSYFKSANLHLFFSEDILVGSSPDITFGMQMDWSL